MNIIFFSNRHSSKNSLMCSIRKQIIIFCTSTNANIDYLSSIPPSQVSSFLDQLQQSDSQQDPTDPNSRPFLTPAQQQLRQQCCAKLKSQDRSASASQAWEETHSTTESLINNLLNQKNETYEIVQSEEGGRNRETEAVIEHVISVLREGHNEWNLLDEVETCVSEEVANVVQLSGSSEESGAERPDKEDEGDLQIESVIECSSITQ